jgi:hypothetical protein
MRTASSSQNPWQASEGDFPSLGTASEKLEFLLQYAVLAPSSHNSQPWLFRIVGDHVDLYADRTRALPVADPADREMLISCGAALGNLRLAMNAFGYTAERILVPQPDDPDLLARVRLGSAYRPTAEQRHLFRAILARRTNRLPFDTARQVPRDLIAAVVEDAEVERAHLTVTQDTEIKAAVAALVSEADEIQLQDPRFRRELAAWIHPSRSRSRDGVPGTAFGMNQILDRVGTPAASFVVRTFDIGGGWAARDRQIASGSPTLALLWTGEDTPRHWVEAGQALSRILLRATDAGVSASFLNQPIEMASLRSKLAHAMGIAGQPQLLLRLGYGPPLPPTPRRPVEDVLD